jgi:hypothetical protein
MIDFNPGMTGQGLSWRELPTNKSGAFFRDTPAGTLEKHILSG